MSEPARDTEPQYLDTILSFQVVVAWAGEGLSEPARLGWWNTDLVDEFGGRDFFERLTPNTYRWTSLEAVREAARRVDEKRRETAANPELIRSLFHFGYEIDSRLEDRWQDLKRQPTGPEDIFDISMTDGEFDRSEFEAWCDSKADIDYRSMPAGRELRGDAPEDQLSLAKQLVAGLVPFDDEYPMPHYTV